MNFTSLTMYIKLLFVTLVVYIRINYTLDYLKHGQRPLMSNDIYLRVVILEFYSLPMCDLLLTKCTLVFLLQ